ncbi:MAG: lipopolysaccharide biosynthesis protein, partial [Phenylobacterium sp.]|nr:lipopolysaccharide biosynthesis protein [Phenylobacterium sp.]
MTSQQPSPSSGPLGHGIASPPGRWSLESLRPAEGEALDVQRWVAVFRRRARLSLAVAFVIFTAFVVFTLIAPSQYTAQTEIVVDARHEQIVNQAPVIGDLPRSTQEANIVDTQVQLLSSRRLAEIVTQELNLVKDPEFNSALPGATGPGALLHAVTGFVSHNLFGSPPPSEARTREKVVDAVAQNLSIRRSGLTYVIGVNFTSKDPAKAARIANAFADNYLAMELDSKGDATGRVNQWLNTRLNGLRQQVQQSEAAVERYKIDNNLLSASGVPLNEQEISSYNLQAATARASLAEDRARLNTARAQLAHGSTGEDVGEALGSNVIQQLRAQRASISASLAGFQGRYGPRHPDMLKAQQQLADTDAQIHSEVKRIISNLEAKVQVSRQRLASIEGTLSSAQGTLAANNRATVRLNELQRNADSAKAVYQSFLDRYKETSAMAGMVAPDGRLVSAASVPTNPSSPDLKINLVLGAMVALMGGLSAASVAELLSSGLSTADDVEKRTGAPYLGSVPLLHTGGRGRGRGRGSPAAYLVSKPLSAFAEAFKGLRTSLLQASDGVPPRVVAITSSVPGEGKTVTAVCFAGSLALQGYRTVLVDCD